MKRFVKPLFALFTSFLLCGCGTGFKATGPLQIQLAIYTPLCMEAVGGSLAEGAPVQTYPCIDGERRQQWMLSQWIRWVATTSST